MKKFNVYLDDVREGHNNGYMSTVIGWEDWVVVRHIEHVKTLLKARLVNEMSLDHDMGDNSSTGEPNPSGKDLVKWMIETNNWPDGFISVHSANPDGARDMRELVERHNRQRSG
ncbi:MAG: cyclic-phosphate processing receiver domain-containing protein [Promethearchaeota archaeon]|jgi:hypothetical protein